MEDTKKSPTPLDTIAGQPKDVVVKKIIKPSITKFIAPIGVVIVTLVISGAMVLNKEEFKKSATTAASNTANTQQVAGTNDTANPSVNIEDVNIDGDPFLGDADAEVVLAYWSDYQCPFCKIFELGTMQTLIDEYVKPGKVKIVFKDFQFLGNDSLAAALYARAIWELYPDKFFEWREAFYDKQDAENSGFGDQASLKAMTATVSGIDADKVTEQISSKSSEYQTQITADRSEGAKLGVTGTPGFVTGTQLIAGAASLSQFTTAIESQLK